MVDYPKDLAERTFSQQLQKLKAIKDMVSLSPRISFFTVFGLLGGVHLLYAVLAEVVDFIKLSDFFNFELTQIVTPSCYLSRT